MQYFAAIALFLTRASKSVLSYCQIAMKVTINSFVV